MQLDELPRGRTSNKLYWARFSRVFQTYLNERITALEGLRDTLGGCIGCGCLSLATCWLYNLDDVAAQKGAGPLYLMYEPVKNAK